MYSCPPGKTRGKEVRAAPPGPRNDIYSTQAWIWSRCELFEKRKTAGKRGRASKRSYQLKTARQLKRTWWQKRTHTRFQHFHNSTTCASLPGFFPARSFLNTRENLESKLGPFLAQLFN